MGIILSVVSAIFGSSKDLVSKHLAFSVSGTVSAFASFFFALPFYAGLLVILWLAGHETFQFSSAFLTYVVLRAATDTAAEWLKMTALRQGDISLVSCFFSLSPFFLLFTSPLLTGDRISSLGNGAILIVVIGSLITAYEPKGRIPSADAQTDRHRLRAIMLSLLAAFFFSLNTCFDRLAVLQASPALSGFAMTALAGGFLFPFVAPFPDARRQLATHCKPFLGRGALELLFMVTKLWALQHLAAQYVMGIARLAVLFSIIGGRVFYGEQHFQRRFLGAIVTLIGVVLILLAI